MLTEEQAERLAEQVAMTNNAIDAGVTLIAEGRPFAQWARELAEDWGYDTDKWPGSCIDWSAAAEELADGYTTVEWEGETFYVV